MPFRFVPTNIDGLVIFEPRVFPDDRGFFLESYNATESLGAGIEAASVQDNHSKSAQGVLRGLHFRKPLHAQGKLVSVLDGFVWDVAVDLRESSSTFGK